MNVTFQHAGATLSGAVVLPPEGEVRAGLVFLHGSGPADFGHWSEWADVFAEHGVASLSYDKPGVGGSEGDWTRQSFANRASEALAALRFLASDVLAEGVPTGVLGMSQGAWIGPHAASASEDVAFVVALSGSSTGPREQDRFRIEHELVRDGFAQDAVDAALRVWDECDALFGSGADDGALFDAFEPHRDEPWSRYFVFGDTNLIAYGRLIWDYDPLPYLARLRCPLLAIWGSADALVDARSSAAAFERVLGDSGNRKTRLVTIHGVDHGLRRHGERPLELFSWIADWIVLED
jgi:pimeloyl-ACP methyl ester carboxylesterase